MSSLHTPATHETNPEPPSLNSTFGLPDSMRKFLAGSLIAATAFLAGCAKSLEDRVSAMSELPSPPAVTVLEHPDWFKNDSIVLRGTPEFVRDESYSTTSTTIVPITTGKSVIFVPQTSTVYHPEYVYNVKPTGDDVDISVRSPSELRSEPTVLSAKVDYKDGRLFLRVEDHIAAEQFQSASHK